uniref:Uncharacterized protein n=1 Tax=Anas platyrhynchos platyrhynchos TaxID=8840 RepID=A0A493TC58_ANAPP
MFHSVYEVKFMYFLAIPKKTIVKVSEAKDSDKSLFGLTTGFWSERPQGRQAVCYLHLPIPGIFLLESPSG